MSTPPSETFDDGSALWEVDPFEVSAHPGDVNLPAVIIDGRSTSPTTALALADALRAAAMHAQRGYLPS